VQKFQDLADLQLIVENTIGKMGFSPKRIRIPYIVRSKSRYDPHQGIKERKKAQKRLEAQAAKERLDDSTRLLL
jgi:hypothetical protein